MKRVITLVLLLALSVSASLVLLSGCAFGGKTVPVYTGMSISSIMSSAEANAYLSDGKDDFDYDKDEGNHNGHFKGDYTAIAPQSEAMKDLFRYAGTLLGYMGLDPFHWSYTTSMTLEVPYTCSHSVENHRWICEDGALVSIGGTGYAVNALQSITEESLTGGSYTYYRLASPVHLSPTEEWVVEIESTGLADIALSPLPGNRAALPALVLNTNLDAVYATASTFEAGGAAFRFAESAYRGEFRYHPDHAYTVLLENRGTTWCM